MSHKIKRKDNGHWQEGSSGNPQGGKATAELRRVLSDYATDNHGDPETDENGNKITNLYAVARALVREAKKGNVQAIEKCFERIDGKVKEVVKHEGDAFGALWEAIQGNARVRPDDDDDHPTTH